MHDSLALDLSRRLSNHSREDFEERAGILQYDAGFTREAAEARSLLQLLQRAPAALLRARIHQIHWGERAGEQRFVIFADDDATATGTCWDGDLGALVRDRFGGAALLSPLK